MNGKLEINILSHAESIIYAFEENNCSKECVKKYSHTSDLNHPNPRRTNERIPVRTKDTDTSGNAGG